MKFEVIEEFKIEDKYILRIDDVPRREKPIYIVFSHADLAALENAISPFIDEMPF